MIGKIILVEDDYKNVIPYLRPKLISWRKAVLSEEEKRVVEETIERKNQELEGNYIDSLKPGELKYMIKKEQRQSQEEQHQIEEMLLEDRKDALAGITEDQVKVRTKKIRYY